MVLDDRAASAGLLVGLIQPEKGTVRAFGTDTRTLDGTALLYAVSVVTQHPLLIADNVRYDAKRNLSDASSANSDSTST